MTFIMVISGVAAAPKIIESYSGRMLKIE